MTQSLSERRAMEARLGAGISGLAAGSGRLAFRLRVAVHKECRKRRRVAASTYPLITRRASGHVGWVGLD